MQLANKPKSKFPLTCLIGITTCVLILGCGGGGGDEADAPSTVWSSTLNQKIQITQLDGMNIDPNERVVRFIVQSPKSDVKLNEILQNIKTISKDLECENDNATYQLHVEERDSEKFYASSNAACNHPNVPDGYVNTNDMKAIFDLAKEMK